MKAPKRAICLAIAFSTFLFACSPTQQAYQQNIKLYFSSNKDVILPNERISDSSADLIYVKNGERPVVTMALAFIEDGQYKWLSRDDAMIITDHGRISRMVGFSENLLYVSNINSDPIQFGAQMPQHSNQWTRKIDTDLGDIGVALTSVVEKTEDILVTIQGIEFSTVKLEEHVSYNSSVHGRQSWSNTFWFESNTGQLIKSSQMLAPNIDRLDISYVSRALRIIGKTNKEVS